MKSQKTEKKITEKKIRHAKTKLTEQEKKKKKLN